MRVVLSTYGSRGDVEPMAGLAVRLRALGAEVRVCAPPDEDFAQRLAGVGVPLVPVGPSARALTKAAPPPSSLPERAAQVIASQFDAVTAAAEGCDVLVATGMLPAAAGALSVAEKLGIRSVSVTFQQLTVPSPHRPPLAYPGWPLPPEVTDNRVLWEFDAQSINALFGAALNTNRAANGLPPVDDVRNYVIGDRPWLATDPILDPWQETPDLDVVQTGAWILPDVHPLPAELLAFLDAGTPPVYVGFGSMPMHTSTDIAQVAIEAIRAQGVARSWPVAGPTWHRSTAKTTASSSARSTSTPCSPGWPPSSTTAARAPRRRPPGPARLRWWCPRSWTSRTGPPGWPSWASARHTPVRHRPSAPCQTRSPRLWPLRPEHERGPWPARSAPTVRRWPRKCCSTQQPAGKGRPGPREPPGIAEPGAGRRRHRLPGSFRQRFQVP